MRFHRLTLALLIAVFISMKVVKCFRMNRGFSGGLSRMSFYSLSSSHGSSSSSSQSKRSLSMQSVSDWTEQKAMFADSFRPEISISASSAYDFSGDMLVVPFYKPKDLKDDSEVAKVST